MKKTASSFVALGTIFFAIGIATSKNVFTILGIVFLAVGLAAPRKKQDPPQD